MTAIAAAGHPTMGRTIAKAAAGVVLLAATAAGLFFGAQAVTRHYQQPARTVSYATQAQVTRTLQQAWHTPATQGDFRADASIQTPDVVSVVQVVGP